MESNHRAGACRIDSKTWAFEVEEPADTAGNDRIAGPHGLIL